MLTLACPAVHFGQPATLVPTAQKNTATTSLGARQSQRATTAGALTSGAKAQKIHLRSTAYIPIMAIMVILMN